MGLKDRDKTVEAQWTETAKDLSRPKSISQVSNEDIFSVLFVSANSQVRYLIDFVKGCFVCIASISRLAISMRLKP